LHLAFLNIIWDLFLQLDHDTETKNGRKKHSLHSKHFRVKIKPAPIFTR